MPRGGWAWCVRVSNDGADSCVVTTLGDMGRGSAYTLQSVAGGGEMGDANKARGRAREEVGSDVVVVEARLGDDGTVGSVGEGEFSGRGVEGAEGISETTKGGGKLAEGSRVINASARVIGGRAKAMVVDGGRANVCVSEEVNIGAWREGEGGKGTLESGDRFSMCGSTVSMEGDDQGRVIVNGDEHNEKTAIRVTGEDVSRAEGVATQENSDTSVRGKRLQGWVTVLGGPKGLVTPLSSPGKLLSIRRTVGFKQGHHIRGYMAKVGSAESVIAQAANIVEMEGDLALTGRGCRGVGFLATT